jgi:hypothetical protein
MQKLEAADWALVASLAFITLWLVVLHYFL